MALGVQVSHPNIAQPLGLAERPLRPCADASHHRDGVPHADASAQRLGVLCRLSAGGVQDGGAFGIGVRFVKIR